MKNLKIVMGVLLLSGMVACSETSHEDNTTHSADTMVIKTNQTDSATNSVSTDTTRR